MPIDASIYQNIQPLQSDPLGMAQKAMQLSTLGMQQMQMARQLRTQSAVQQAYMANTDPQSGQLDRQGFLSQVGRDAPWMQEQFQNQFAAEDKAQADTQAAQADASSKLTNIVGPKMEYLAGLPEDQRASAYPQVVQNLKDQGFNTSVINGQYDHDEFVQHFNQWRATPNYQQYLQNQATTGETQAKTAEALANAAKARSETPAGGQGAADPNTDPATLVPKLMPKDARPKALEEIKNAQDLNALSPKIMAAFDMGTSKNPITAAQGQKQFAGLMNTTVKDTEGTVRQAAMDSIQKNMAPSGLTALPGENDAKRATVLSYLQSKQSAPFNKSYGIDLTKFKSTAPYQEPSKDQGSGSGFPGVSSANASDPTPHDQAALQWVKDPKNSSSPQAFKIRAMLKSKGLL